MITRKKILTASLITIFTLAGVSLAQVAAQENLSDRHLGQIRDNCISAQNTLTQLHTSDALLRVNRGQLYESTSTKLMTRFNTRVANNGFNNEALVSITDSYERTLDAFRASYKSYEEQLASALGIDCSKNPANFYDVVSSARTKRSQVHSDIIRLNRYITDYQEAVEKLESDIKTANGSVRE